MKYLIIPSQNLSATGIKQKAEVTTEDLPWPIRRFLAWCSQKGKKPGVVADEISWFHRTSAAPERNKDGASNVSSRCRLLKLLTPLTSFRLGLTGTLLTKSPLNIVDPYQFLNADLFPDNQYALMERHCVMMSLRTSRGRRVPISQKEWFKQRKRMVNAYKLGGESQLSFCIDNIGRDIGINREACEHILANKKFTPFMRINQLMKRVEDCTITVNREDVFDVSFDKFALNPIPRPVELGAKAKQLGNELVKVGFTDNMTLGKAPALELMIRLQDICNGFEPLKNESTNGISYKPLAENAKLDGLISLLSEIGTDQNQVAVWCSRVNAFDSIAERLNKEGISYVRYSGSENQKQKEAAEELFQSGEARVFLANQASAGFGLNCLKDCNYAVFYACNDSVEQDFQAKHRILRGQSKTPKFAYRIYAKGSVEERSMAALDAGRELLSASNKKQVFQFT